PEHILCPVFYVTSRLRIHLFRPPVTPEIYPLSLHDALPISQQLLRGLGYEPRVRPNCTKLSVIGGGMNDEPGVMARIVEALTTRQITILQSADSNTTIWILVTGDAAAEALEALHAAFGLHLATHL